MPVASLLLIILLVAVIVAIVGWFIYRLNIGAQKAKENEAKLAEAEKKDPSEWTEEDRKFLLNDLEKHRSFLTFQQYDVLKAKYKGTTSVTEMLIKGGYSLSEIDKMSTANTGISQADATKTIVKDAVVGGVIAGPAGAVVGAIVGKNKVDSNSSDNNK